MKVRPDFYLGAELWDLNLVDPDNRRPVDFSKRQHLLDQIMNSDEKEPADIQRLLDSFENGKIKLYEIFKSLGIRRGKRELFEEGAHIPLEVKGSHKNHIISFCRRKRATFTITIVPRFVASLTNVPALATGTIWKDTYICLPANAPTEWREIFTDKSLFSQRFQNRAGFPIEEVLKIFPVALLSSGENDNS